MAYDKVGPRALILPGAVIVTAAMTAFTTLGAATPIWLVIGMHMMLSVGTAMMMTPLMTTALGAVAPHRYPHASAIINTLQQVSGAAGTALFITLFSVGAAAGRSDTPLADLADAVGAAFGVGAIISAVSIALALFLRRPSADDWVTKSAGAGRPE